MKTTVEFEEKDLEGCGQMIIVDNYPSITTAYKVGYGFFGRDSYYFLVSLADGMVCYQSETKKELVEKINKEKKFRPMTQKEIIEIIGGQGNRFAS